MRYFYVVPTATMTELIDFGGGQMMPRGNLVHPGIGWHGIYLDGTNTNMLISTAFADDYAMEQFHAHPTVARLPHPLTQSTMPICDLWQESEYAYKQFTEDHWNLLVNKFALDDTHTVWDLHDKAIAMDPSVKLSPMY